MTASPQSLVSAPSGIALRDLTNAQFVGRYGCDRFTAAVLGSRFRYIVGNMATQLVSRAFSPILRDSSDLSAAFCGPPEIGYPMPAVAPTMPVFFGSIPHAIPISVEEFGLDRLGPGDTLISNDPYRVGTHLNDVCFMRPVLTDSCLIGVLTIRAHMLDWGGKAKGGFALDKASLYEDGLVLAPERLYKGGEPVEALFKIIRDNTRFPEMIIPDIQTIKTCLDSGEARLLETYHKYGREPFMGSIEYICDASAEVSRSAIDNVPDGTYEGEEQLDTNGLPGDTAFSVRVKVNKFGSNIEFDLSGSSPANNSSLNCMWPEAASAVVMAFKWLLDPLSPFTSGVYRHIDVVVPPGSAVNPTPPTASNLYHQVVHALFHATTRALNLALGPAGVAIDSGDMVHEHVAGTYRADGQSWFMAGGTVRYGLPWGATSAGDADSSLAPVFLNTVWSGDEVIEADNPLVVMRRDYLPDSGGPGQHRGGASAVVDTLWLEPGAHYVWAFMVRRQQNCGVHGGRSGRAVAGWFWDPTRSTTVSDNADFLPIEMPPGSFADAIPIIGVLDPETNEADPQGELHICLEPVFASANTTERVICNGGGGWGDAKERDPQAVLEDVRDGYVSIDGAANDYGVVVVGDPAEDPEGIRIDDKATSASRRRPTPV